jgi:predicted RNase H-like HicB family nuclease
MKSNVELYPTIFTEYKDESGHYFVVTSPDIQGLVTDGEDIKTAVTHAIDAIATLFDGRKEFPEPTDPADWQLARNQRIAYIPVDMITWYHNNSRTVRRNVTLPEWLNNYANENNINVSQFLTKALEAEVEL